MYLCTKGKILAHADVDMSLLLPREEWQGRSTWEFGRTGLEGDFQLRLPGEPLPQQQHQQGGEAASIRQRANTAVVTMRAELSRADSDSAPSSLISSSGAGPSVRGGGGGGGGERSVAAAAAASRPGGGRGRGGASGASTVSTWSYLAPHPRRKRQRGVITAALQRLELKPTPSRGGGGAAVSGRADCDGGVLVGITGAAGELLLPGTMEPGEGAGGGGGGGLVIPPSPSRNNFHVIGCGERGEVDTEDSGLLEAITWRWEGEFPDSAATDADGGDGGDVLGFGGGEGEGKHGGARGPLASIKVLAAGSGGRRRGDVEIAEGFVPWPSSACSGRQHVNVTLVSPEGFQVGSCRVCLLLSFSTTATAADDSGAAAELKGTGAPAGGFERVEEADEDEETLSEQESEQQAAAAAEEEEFEDAGEEEKERGGGSSGGRGGRGRDGDRGSVGFAVGGTVRTNRGRAEEQEPPLEGTRTAAGGTVPRRYRMSINLASVKDLENAAYVVRPSTHCCGRERTLCSRHVFSEFVLRSVGLG